MTNQPSSSLRPARPMVVIVLLFLQACLCWGDQPFNPDPNAPHGGIPMGVPNGFCDDGKLGIEVDWDPKSKAEYTCTSGRRKTGLKLVRDLHCDRYPKEQLHVCFPKEIHYDEDLPTSGAHRPLWPQYGEYVYLPLQRWLHSLEHGSIVFLYHPCADPDLVEEFKAIARSCLHKHVISPYKKLPPGVNFALIGWTCRLTLSRPIVKDMVKFVQMYGLQAPEGEEMRDGQYKEGLLRPAHIVSDENDSVLCPNILQNMVIADRIQKESFQRMKFLSLMDRRQHRTASQLYTNV